MDKFKPSLCLANYTAVSCHGCISPLLYTRPWLLAGLLFALPLLYVVVIYLGSLAAMLVNSFYQLDDFSGKIVQEFTLKNYAALLQPANLSIILRTVSMAAVVTVARECWPFPWPITWPATPARVPKVFSTWPCSCRSGLATLCASMPGS